MAPRIENTIAPIVNIARRHLVKDLATAISLGFIVGEVYWHGYVLPKIAHRDAYFAKIEEQKRNGTYKINVKLPMASDDDEDEDDE